MRKTTAADNENNSRRLAVDTRGLQAMLCCGKDTAIKIGIEAKARVQIGKRVIWNVEKVQRYLDSVSDV